MASLLSSKICLDQVSVIQCQSMPTSDTCQTDCERIGEPQDWQTVQRNLRNHIGDPKTLPATGRLLATILPFPRSLATLVGKFTGAINPYEADVNVLWGLIDLNIKVKGSHLFRSTGGN